MALKWFRIIEDEQMEKQMTQEMQALKERLKATWMSGDYGHFAKFLETGAMQFLDSLSLSPGQSMLDVGCGAGQIAIPAAQRVVSVTGIDLASNLVEQTLPIPARNSSSLSMSPSIPVEGSQLCLTKPTKTCLSG